MSSAPRRDPGVDRFGAVASSLCAVHCAICALLPAAFGAMGLGALLGHQAEWIFTIIAIGFAAGALVLSWSRHRSPGVAAMLLIGILGLLASRGLEAGAEHDHAAHHHVDETAPATRHEESARGLAGATVGVLAGLLLLSGHLLNLRAIRCCDRRECD